MSYLSDPEHTPENWDEPIMADDQQQAKRRCKKLAETFTEQGKSPVELVDVLKASTKTQRRFLCRFRS